MLAFGDMPAIRRIHNLRFIHTLWAGRGSVAVPGHEYSHFNHFDFVGLVCMLSLMLVAGTVCDRPPCKF